MGVLLEDVMCTYLCKTFSHRISSFKNSENKMPSIDVASELFLQAALSRNILVPMDLYLWSPLVCKVPPNFVAKAEAKFQDSDKVFGEVEGGGVASFARGLSWQNLLIDSLLWSIRYRAIRLATYQVGIGTRCSPTIPPHTFHRGTQGSKLYLGGASSKSSYTKSVQLE